MDTALHRAKLPAACALAATGELASPTDPAVAMVVDLVPADCAVAERATSRPDTVEEAV